MTKKFNLSYSSVSGLIESLVYKEGVRIKIPDQDAEDIAQEIRLACIKAMPGYNFNKIGPSPYKFLQTCTKNHIFNLLRGVYLPNNPPCKKCPQWDKHFKDLNIGCTKMNKYKKRMMIRAELKQPNSLDDSSVSDLSGFSAIDLNQDIQSILPPDLLKSYIKMISGDVEQISTSHKIRIRRIVKEYLNNA